VGIFCAQKQAQGGGRNRRSIQNIGCDQIYFIIQMQNEGFSRQNIQIKIFDGTPIVKKVVRRINVCADMYASGEVGGIGIFAIVHGENLLQLNGRVAGPDGEI
jgi:hypothetical protein